MASLLLILLLSFSIILLVSSSNNTSKDGIIIIPVGRSLAGGTIIRGQYFYTKYMPTFRFDLNTATSTFVKIPGLIVPVYHATPMLYKIWFSAGCYFTWPGGSSFIRIMIDDYILIGNRLLPNTKNRDTYDSTLGNSLTEVDAHGASFMRNGDSSGNYYTCPKFEVVYLPAGLHVIEVVARTDHPALFIHTGILTVELTQYQDGADIQLRFPIKY